MPLTSSDFFVLRTPLFPVAQYKDIFEKDPAQLIAGKPEFAYALYIGSRELVKELNRFIEQPGEFNEKKINKLKSSLYKYWVRACSRSTPYGVFAGCSLGTIGAETQLTINGPGEAIQQVRLDMDYYTKVCSYILKEVYIRKELRFYTNNSVYKIGDKFRYAEYTINNNRRKYLLSSITNSVFIEQIIEKAQAGLTIGEMVQLILAEDDSIAQEEAEGFVNELIDAQLLISEMEPKITGPGNLPLLIDRLESIADAKALRDQLLALSVLFSKQDYDQERLSEIHQQCETDFPIALPKDLLQIDLFKSTSHCTLSADMVNDITQKLSKLLAICNSYPQGNTELTNFGNKLNELYDGQEIPLNLALDAETGIGYGASIDNSFHTPFVEDIMAGGGSNGPSTINWTPLQQLSLDKYEQFIKDRLTTVHITDEDLKPFGKTDNLNFASSCFLFGSLHKAAPGAPEGQDYLFSMQSLGGPSAANLLGRFCSGDTEMTEKVKDLLREEEATDPDAIFAEVVHFPEARATNVLIRPILRPYEIPYVGVASVDAEHQLPLSDLMVSVQRGNIVLRSKKWNKRVIPRLSSAHNYGYNSLPAYKFLCDLQQQGVRSGFYWDWGVCSGKPYLPRVMYHNIIISRATWELKQKDVDTLTKDKNKIVENITRYREERNMPALVTIADADNELLIDCTQPESLEILFDFVKKRQSVKLREFLFGENESMVTDTDNRAYTNEVLIPLRYKPVTAEQKAAARFHDQEQMQSIPRNYTPGSEWLYVKIYCGYALTEELLSTYFAEKIPEWKEAGLAESFFFLRYADPNPHLRLRFLNSADRSKNEQLLTMIFDDLQPYIEAGQIKKIQTDTYTREIERYGASTMALSEQLFDADSHAVLGIVSMLEGPEGEEYRWKLAARGLDILLDDFGFNLEWKKNLLGNLQRGFVEEFGGAKLLNKQLNDKYRRFQKDIESFLNDEDDEQNDIADVIDIFRQRSARIRELAPEIVRLAAEESGNENQHWDLLSSYIHMFLNRLFVAKQRKHELLIYHFLEKYYTSKVAQAAKAVPVS
ncbi:lantibiotic dehydratase [Taibaiella chishuiensis]|uniref:Thiopeptide-type bacteriocin biosynthesis protein n=1 Tax=Taibaiella chishuiensis TaxID=1434707 RepID=A0A2P8DBX5_9BACT|nr:lantibiotic dehydratase [Taibaiella chishuiensis]PSK94719.1 thiopeptide-type bacteriocin biosynthesis protein [Taibaiella chishuiensis]